MDHEFSAELLESLVTAAKGLPSPVRPATADDGRKFYLMMSTRERMIQNLQPGWTYRAVTFTRRDGSCFALFEPVEIEAIEVRSEGKTAYFENTYIASGEA